MFLKRGGSIDCRVTGSRHFSEDLPQVGLEIPCVLMLRGAHRDIEKVKMLLTRAFLSSLMRKKMSHPK